MEAGRLPRYVVGSLVLSMMLGKCSSFRSDRSLIDKDGMHLCRLERYGQAGYLTILSKIKLGIGQLNPGSQPSVRLGKNGVRPPDEAGVRSGEVGLAVGNKTNSFPQK